MRRVLLVVMVTLLAACATRGGNFKSDAATLSQIVVGKTSPQEAVEILGAPPTMRQNLPNGTIAWHWQRIAAGAFVGITDHRTIVLQFTSDDGGKTWQFSRVLSTTNVDLPPGMPFGTAIDTRPTRRF